MKTVLIKCTTGQDSTIATTWATSISCVTGHTSTVRLESVRCFVELTAVQLVAEMAAANGFSGCGLDGELMELPMKPARQGLQSGQQSIKWDAVGDGQQLKVLSGEQPGQVVEQIADARQFADARLGGDLPAESAPHIHRIGGVTDAGMGYMQELGNCGADQSRECSAAASSTPGRGPSCSSGIRRAQGLPSWATRIASPTWAASISREKWVLASCTVTTRSAMGRRIIQGQLGPLLEQAGGLG